ncbi:terminase small subunit [uncultured Agrobacterium sp.]|uniref:terminase small subunit n=1 Tax=uncultured Agrobacterium sp. TaxID=157277 RepID=UPI0025FD2342|nr:terminase small subunit [uncultured Agrobacterium sp.]
MARQKSSSRVRKSAEPSGEIASPPHEIPEDSAPAVTRREAAKLRLVSVKQAATLLNRDRNTVQKWLDRGCPFVTKGDRALGIAWELDLADVVKWLEERAGENAAEKFASSTDGQVSEDEAKRRKALAQAVVAELDMLERLDTIVLKSDVLDLIAADYGEIKAKLISISDTVGASVDPAIATHVSGIVDKHIRKALASLKAIKKLTEAEDGDAPR